METIFNSIKNVTPSQLADKKFFDFTGLTLAGSDENQFDQDPAVNLAVDVSAYPA